MIQRPKRQSIHYVGIEVKASDQLLLLIACTVDGNERRAAAARQSRSPRAARVIKKQPSIFVAERE